MSRTLKPALLRPQAEQDLVDATRYYVEAGGTALGEKAFDTAMGALSLLQREPAIGSPRLGQLCGIPGLRAWRVTGFPLQWFYFEAEGHLDVVRLLGDRRDIATLLDDEAP